MNDNVNITLSVHTHEALKNLFGILQLDGNSFDDKLYEFACMAFAARADPLMSQRFRLPNGEGSAKRQHINLKTDTSMGLRMLFYKQYPYSKWISWDWYINDIIEQLADVPVKSYEVMRVHK